MYLCYGLMKHPVESIFYIMCAVRSLLGMYVSVATPFNVQVDSVLGKEFAEKYTGLRNSATALLSRLNISLHSGTIATLLELLTSLLPAVRYVCLASGTHLREQDVIILWALGQFVYGHVLEPCYVMRL